MGKLGVITDGISRDLQHAVSVMAKHDLKYAELQFIYDKEVGDLNKMEIAHVKHVLNAYNMQVPCISRHNFAGKSVFEVEIGDTWYKTHMDSMKRCIDMAHTLNCPMIRTMSFKKEMILFGDNGAENWNVAKGAWQKTVDIFHPIVELCAKNNMGLVVETGNNAIITSCVLGKKLIDDLDTPHLKIMWDPANALFCNENPTTALESLAGPYLGHIHIKDIVVNIPHAQISNRPLGQGHMQPHLQRIARWLQHHNYNGAISLESVYCPPGGTFEQGFESSVQMLKSTFG